MVAGVPLDPGPHKIMALCNPSEDEIEQIMRLKRYCEDRLGIDILLTENNLRSLDVPGTGAYKLVKNEHIIGFAFLYSFKPEEAETIIFTHPDEDWRTASSELLNTVREECERRGHARLLIVNDQRFSEGVGPLITMGHKLTLSEHRMELVNYRAMPGQLVDLNEVGDDDSTLRLVEHACHGQFHSKPDQRRFIASFNGRPVGKIDVCIDRTKAELTGFCVIPDLRRRGLGSSILTEIIKVLRLEGMSRIVLDVRTDNVNALSLYENLGFRKEFTMDYYEMVLK
jgi:ribosomal protein S18 acetylase RimI-like enzyme